MTDILQPDNERHSRHERIYRRRTEVASAMDVLGALGYEVRERTPVRHNLAASGGVSIDSAIAAQEASADNPNETQVDDQSSANEEQASASEQVSSETGAKSSEELKAEAREALNAAYDKLEEE